MANIKSQIKRNRSNERRRLRNQGVRSELKTRVKSATTALEQGGDDAPRPCAWRRSASTRPRRQGRIHKNRPPGAPPAS